ncbi:MAG TPA: esterase, partial [Noviherbaspirillum sp.]
MRQFKFVAVMFAAIVLAACGGSDNASSNANANANSNKIKFSSQVSFGDSLTDVGTYAVGTIKALGGGKYTINSATAKNWTEVVAAQLDLPAPCAAQTGLDGDAAQGFSVPVTNFPNCTGYAQGGARVTNPVGPGNKQLGGAGATLGLLTVPVVRQIWNHLAAHGNAFKGDEVVFVMAGGNDLFINLDTLSASAAAAGTEAGAAEAANSGATQQSITDAAQAAAAAYVQAHAAETVQAMGVAGAELAGYVNNLILGKGVKYVVVVNLPDA